jgi:hypothetical protein
LENSDQTMEQTHERMSPNQNCPSSEFEDQDWSQQTPEQICETKDQSSVLGINREIAI